MGKLPAVMPQVTCLCLTTHDRSAFLAQAVENFKSQTYPNKELLIVDDVKAATIGEKRNLGISEAPGEIIAHWDDDDYSAPGRLADQVAMLESSGLAVAGYSAMYFTDGTQWWKYRHGGNYAIGTSLCFRKSWWADHRFPNQQTGEDNVFQREAAGAGQLISKDAERMMVASIHRGNTCPRNLGNQYRPVQRPEGIGSPFDATAIA